MTAGDNASTRQETPRAPVLPWMVRLQLMLLMAFSDLALRPDGTVNRCVFSLADWQARARARPDSHGVRSGDVVVNASRGLWARVFSPPASGGPPLPVVVYFHGGGFVVISAASVPFDAVCRRLCHKAGAVVVSVNYRLAPEHPWPAAYDDGVDVLRYLGNCGGRLPADLAAPPVDLSRCFIAGDSAGGNIAHHVALRWTSDAAVATTTSPVRLAGIVLLQPFFGGEYRTEAERRLDGVAPILSMRRSDWSWRAFLPPHANRDHQAAHVTDDAVPDGFPPAMVVVGGFDPLQDWQRMYVEMLQRHGRTVVVVELPDAIHGFYMFPKLAEAGTVMEDIRAFMESCNTSIAAAAE